VTLPADYGFFGNYPSWEAAQRDASGYDAPSIIGTVKDAAWKVKTGRAAYERDGVVFDRIELPYPLLALLLRIGVEARNRLRLIDFGGSLGTTYRQTREFLSCLDEIRWTVVEQPHFVECGRALFSDAELSFAADIPEARAVNPDARTILLSGVIGYVPEPGAVIAEIVREGFENVVLDRTAFVESGPTRIVVQRVPPSIYAASYPARLFRRDDLLGLFGSSYRVVAEFDSYCDPVETIDGIRVPHKGLALRRQR
jgi:putative methyltransferase (TIGR04325 family)